MHHQVLVIGGGTGGIMTTSQLKRQSKKKLDIAIIEPGEKHYYQPAWTLVGAGELSFKSTVREEKNYIPSGVKWIKDKATAIHPGQNKVVTENHGEITYDYLIVSTGVKMDLDKLEGLSETMGKNNVCSNYIDPNYTWEVLQNFKGGNAIFTQAPGAIKCGGAPQKIMYLAEHHFRRSKVRDKSNVSYIFPGSVLFAVEPFQTRLLEIVDERKIILKFPYEIVRIDGENKKVYFRLPTDKSSNDLTRNDPGNSIGEELTAEHEVAIHFDMIHLAPHMSPPEFIQKSPLAYQEGPDKGYIKVNINTLQTEYKNVFALGDCAALPTAKTGAAIRKQSPALIEHLLSQIENRKAKNIKYEGYSSCPIITGYGKMLLAEFKYDNIRDSNPFLNTFFSTTKDTYAMWILKKHGLPFFYWNSWLKGLKIP